MKLVTFQTEAAFNKLQRKGYLIGTKKYIIPDFLKAYDWLRKQMNDKIGPSPLPDQYPIWAWYQGEDFDNLEARCEEIEIGHRGVRLEIEIDEKQVLLSDFETWHMVLNNSYLAISEEDYDRFEDESKVNSDTTDRIEKSWERIFDLDQIVDENWISPKEKKTIQATFWKLELNQIKNVKWLDGTKKI